MRGYTEIEHPDAYYNAVQGRIRARANAKRAKAFEQAEPALWAWLTWVGEPIYGGTYGYDENGRLIQDDPNGEYRQVKGYTKHPAGPAPSFARKAIEEWGAPHPNAVPKLKEILAERLTSNAEREAKWAAEKANATPWTAGRQVVEGVIISLKEVEAFRQPRYSNYVATQTKWIVKTDDGRRVYLSAPSAISGEQKGARVRFTVTIEPSKDDPIFAFGSRPAKSEVVTNG
jgi:hypothetical protein